MQGIREVSEVRFPTPGQVEGWRGSLEFLVEMHSAEPTLNNLNIGVEGLFLQHFSEQLR